MNCIIIEDQAPAQRILKKYILDIGTLKLIASFTNAIDAVAFLNSQTVDLIFLDIHLPKISGLDFLESLTNPPSVILTTAFTEFAVESYELNVIDYLVKPFSYKRFVQAASKVATHSNLSQLSKKDLDFYIKSGHDYIKINLNEVLYIQSDMDYTEVHLDTVKHLTSETLTHWEEKLNKKIFVRVHRSYLINSTKVIKISSNQIYLKGGAIIPIGRAYKDHFISNYVK